jgi:hypothetical protein
MCVCFYRRWSAAKIICSTGVISSSCIISRVNVTRWLSTRCNYKFYKRLSIYTCQILSFNVWTLFIESLHRVLCRSCLFIMFISQSFIQQKQCLMLLFNIFCLLDSLRSDRAPWPLSIAIRILWRGPKYDFILYEKSPPYLLPLPSLSVFLRYSTVQHAWSESPLKVRSPISAMLLQIPDFIVRYFATSDAVQGGGLAFRSLYPEFQIAEHESLHLQERALLF